MDRIQSPTIPLDLIIKEYPELWDEFKEDEEAWAWFKKNMPHYTKDRPRVAQNRWVPETAGCILAASTPSLEHGLSPD